MILEAGDHRYEFVEGWGELPDNEVWGQVGGVAIDSRDRVHVFTRNEHPYMVFDSSGKLLDTWGRGIFEQAHGICVLPDDSVILVDRMGQVALKYSPEGKHLLGLGNRGIKSDTGYTDENPIVDHPGPPFHYPTDASFSPNGDFYVSDGYGNCRIHKFDAKGELLFSWGEPGEGPGQFKLVHSVWEHKERVYVADRMNHRIQVFTPDGKYLTEWPGFRQPCKIFIDKDDIVYVAELEARVSILGLDGQLLGRWGGQRDSTPGQFVGPHGIWTDSRGDIYVAEVIQGARLQKFARIS